MRHGNETYLKHFPLKCLDFHYFSLPLQHNYQLLYEEDIDFAT